MRILIVGNGGREHTIAWKLSQSPQVTTLYVAPGNGGTERLPRVINIPISSIDLSSLRDFALAERVDLTVVGPEAPLVEGIVDLFQRAGLPIFGPSRRAAQLEGSKAFAKHFMERHHIPTAQAAIFDDFDEAMRFLRTQDDPPVVKASGLAAGKGVILPETMEEAAAVVQDILLNGRFGAAGNTVLLEERLSGPELSILALCDGKDFMVLPPAQDHKRLLDGDHGPNTGGMGAFAPSPLATPALLAEIEETILRPTLAGMAAEGAPYTGVLYAGLMLTPRGPHVIEFNCRLGDPETQAVLPLLQGDLLDLLLACTTGHLASLRESHKITWQEQAALTVVLASRGYPGEYEQGVEITGIEEAEQNDCLVFHAGTKWVDNRLVTAGGRVLNVTATGNTLTQAAKRVYAGIRKIHYNGAYYRKDIAARYR
ncbi:MAG: phosphoribosylamine--glycine ligase [Caldilineaceae bacterium]